MRTGFYNYPSNDSIALLRRLWSQRNELTAVERRGFGNLLYVTLLGHVEGVLSTYLKTRISAAADMIPWADLPKTRTITENRKKRTFSTEPHLASLQSMLHRYETSLDSAGIEKLIELYGAITGTKFEEAVTKDTVSKLRALAKLRNIFAHGRVLFLELEMPPVNKGSLSGSPLQHPVEILIQAGLLDNLEYDGITHNKFADCFYSDDGMRCFWKLGQEVDVSLRECSLLNIFTKSLLPSPLEPLP